MTTAGPRMKPIRTKLAAAAAACALLTTAGMASASAATRGRQSGAALQAALHRDLSRYLTTRHKAEHISAISLRVTYPGASRALTWPPERPGMTAGRRHRPARCGRSAATPRPSPR